MSRFLREFSKKFIGDKDLAARYIPLASKILGGLKAMSAGLFQNSRHVILPDGARITARFAGAVHQVSIDVRGVSDALLKRVLARFAILPASDHAPYGWGDDPAPPGYDGPWYGNVLTSTHAAGSEGVYTIGEGYVREKEFTYYPFSQWRDATGELECTLYAEIADKDLFGTSVESKVAAFNYGYMGLPAVSEHQNSDALSEIASGSATVNGSLINFDTKLLGKKYSVNGKRYDELSPVVYAFFVKGLRVVVIQDSTSSAIVTGITFRFYRQDDLVHAHTYTLPSIIFNHEFVAGSPVGQSRQLYFGKGRAALSDGSMYVADVERSSEITFPGYFYRYRYQYYGMYRAEITVSDDGIPMVTDRLEHYSASEGGLNCNYPGGGRSPALIGGVPVSANGYPLAILTAAGYADWVEQPHLGRCAVTQSLYGDKFAVAMRKRFLSWWKDCVIHLSRDGGAVVSWEGGETLNHPAFFANGVYVMKADRSSEIYSVYTLVVEGFDDEVVFTIPGDEVGEWYWHTHNSSTDVNSTVSRIGKHLLISIHLMPYLYKHTGEGGVGYYDVHIEHLYINRLYDLEKMTFVDLAELIPHEGANFRCNPTANAGMTK
jgi:hypothetical protein